MKKHFFCLCLILLSLLIFPLVPIVKVSANSFEAISETKYYCNATIDDDFSEDSVIVVINKKTSKTLNKFNVSQFKQININKIDSLTKRMESELNASSTFEKAIHTNEKSSLINYQVFRQIIEITLENPGKENVLIAIEKLEKLDFVESAEPNYYFDTEEICSEDNMTLMSVVPNDPSICEQYALEKIDAFSAWEYTKGLKSVRVGIIDSGIYEHPDLMDNLVPGWDFVHNNNVTSDDETGHGTHIAGIIGAKGNNAIGVSGVNWNVSLVPLQVVTKSFLGLNLNII